MDKIHNVRFIKIDVEGTEDIVLLGALELIKRDKPLIMIESDPNSNINNMHKIFEISEKISYNIHFQYFNEINHLLFPF